MFEEIPMNCKYAYARVSSKSQQDNSSLESQKQEFLKLGVPEKNIRIEVGSAADNIQDRPIFYQLIDDELRENDLLFVTKIDRCSRNTLEFLKLQERLHQKNVTFISLDLPYANDMAVNKLIAANLAAIATFENERRKERQRQGIAAARKAGKYFGRKTVIYKKLIDQVRQLKETNQLSITQIAKITGRGRSTIYKVLKEESDYIPYNRLVPNKSNLTDLKHALIRLLKALESILNHFSYIFSVGGLEKALSQNVWNSIQPSKNLFKKRKN